MDRVLITGASGNVGREVVTACSRAGLRVRVADRASHRSMAESFERVSLDFTAPQTWDEALRGCDGLFLLRPPPISDMQRTLNPFLDRAYATGVEHVVFLSVLGAETMSWVPHNKVERHLQELGNRWTVLRPGFFAQNLQDAYRRDITEDHRLFVPAGAGRVAFLDVKDVGEVTAAVFSQPRSFREQALTLTGPEAFDFREVAAMLTEELGIAIEYEAASILAYARHLLVRRRMPLAQVLVQTFLHWGLRRGDAQHVDPTIERLLQRNATPLRDYIARNKSYWVAGK